MFRECSDITEIDLSNFDTSNVENMQLMFYGCSSLTSLNLSNFNTSRVTWMDAMFYGCSSLTSLNLSSFDISQVTYMHYMFYNCSSLTSLNLSNFNISRVIDMYYVQPIWPSFILSKLNISKLVKYNNMFDGCTNLEYINLKNFKEISLSYDYYSDLFNNVPNNIVVCLNKNNSQNEIYPQISNKICHIEDCTDNWKLNQKKIIDGTNECITNCADRNLYEYNGKCISECPNGDYKDDNNIDKCKCELEKCFTCPTVALNKQLCTECNKNYYKMENDPLNLGEYFNCYNESPNGYYLDAIDKIYKKCYYTCETCEIKGDNEFHNCLKCNTEFKFGINRNNYFNCYINCSYYYYFDNNNSLFYKLKKYIIIDIPFNIHI